MIRDRAIYRDGRRLAEPRDLPGMGDACRDGDGDGVGWVALYQPSEQEFAAVVREFDLPVRFVEDAVHGHQRLKLERHGETLFCVLRAARYIDDAEAVEFSELHVFVAQRFVITVRLGDAPDLPALRGSLESRPDVLRRGPVAILYAIIERIVDDYGPLMAGIETDIDEIEDAASAARPTCRVVSTSSPARSSRSSARPDPWLRCWTG